MVVERGKSIAILTLRGVELIVMIGKIAAYKEVMASQFLKENITYLS